MKTVVGQGAWRSRWAAVGAAVAVTLGAGGMVAVNAAPSEPSSFVSITPTRILDTRTDVGLSGPFVSGEAQTMQVTGTVATQPPGDADAVNAEVVPSTATSVVFNVTVVNPQTKGFLSVRPGDATGFPATSNINWAVGGANIANAVTVQLPTAGDINIFVNGTVGHVLIDVAGYNIPGNGAPGPAGPAGPVGPSNAYATQIGVEAVDAGAGTVEVMKIAVPAGSYAVNTDFYGRPQSVAGIEILLCRLIAVEGAIKTQFDFVRPTTESLGTNAIVALTGLITLDAGGDITVVCQSDGASGFNLFGHSLVLINVGSATI